MFQIGAHHQESNMLVEQTMEKLNALKLYGAVAELRQWLDKPKDKDLAPIDLVGLVVDAEWHYREGRKLTTRLRNAKLRQPASIEDIDYAHSRGLVKSATVSRWRTAACRGSSMNSPRLAQMALTCWRCGAWRRLRSS
jgi:hypothetical protein